MSKSNANVGTFPLPNNKGIQSDKKSLSRFLHKAQKIIQLVLPFNLALCLMEISHMEESRFNYKRIVIAAILGLVLGLIIFSLSSDPKETPVAELLFKSVYLSGAFSAIALFFSVVGFMLNTLIGGSSPKGSVGSGSDSGTSTGYDGGGYSGGGCDGGGGGCD